MTVETNGKEHEHDAWRDDWLSNAVNFASAHVEGEGLFGLVHIAATTATRAALRAVSDATGGGRLPLSSSSSTGDGRGRGVYDVDVVVRTRRPSDDDDEDREENSPFSLLGVALLRVADIVLSAISPMLVVRRGDGGGGREDRYHVRCHSSRLIRADADHDCFSPAGSISPPPHLGTDASPMNRSSLATIRTSSSSSSSSSPSSSPEDVDEDDDDNEGGMARYFDPSEYPARDDDEVESVYFDAAGSIPGLSSASYGSSSQPTEEDDDHVDDRGNDGISPIPSHVDVIVRARIDDDEEDSTTSRAFYYLDASDIASEVGRNVVIDDGKFYAASDRVEDAESLSHVLDAFVERSLRIAAVDDGSTTRDGDCWKPDDQTRKFLDRRRCNEDDCGSEEEWERVPETEVLKWTRSSCKLNSPMLRTQGVVDMTPSQLRDLLLDCDRVRSINRNLIHKENVVIFGGVTPGIAKIVRHVMKVPIVGSTIHGLSLTHSRRLEDGGYLIVSQSVGDDSSMLPANPYYSMSILRPVPNSNKTELTNVAESSSTPMPKFLVQKVASMAAVDFFNNLRCYCKEM